MFDALKGFECNGWPGVIAWSAVVGIIMFACDIPFPKVTVKVVALAVFTYYVFWYWGR